MVARQIVALPYTGDFLRKVCRSSGPDEFPNGRRENKPLTLGTHQCNQGFGPIKGPCADRVALVRIRVEKGFGGPSIHGGGEFPAKVDRISNAKIKPLTADGCMDMSSVPDRKSTRLN